MILESNRSCPTGSDYGFISCTETAQVYGRDVQHGGGFEGILGWVGSCSRSDPTGDPMKNTGHPKGYETYMYKQDDKIFLKVMRSNRKPIYNSFRKFLSY